MKKRPPSLFSDFEPPPKGPPVGKGHGNWDKDRFGKIRREDLVKEIRTRLINRLDLLFAKKEGQLHTVLSICDAADQLAAAIQDGDQGEAKAVMQRFLMMRQRIPGAASRMTATVLMQAIMEGLFPEEFSEEDEDEDVAYRQHLSSQKSSRLDLETRLTNRLANLPCELAKHQGWYDEILPTFKGGLLPDHGGKSSTLDLEVAAEAI